MLNAEARVHTQDGYLRNTQSSPSNAQLFQFMLSQPTPLGWTNDTIPAHDLSKAYLRRELGTVEILLSRLAYNLSPVTLSSFEALPLKMSWALQKTSGADLGENGTAMNEEALSVRKWGVNLWRHLTFICPSKNALYHLADYLTNLSVCYRNVGDLDGAYGASKEAMDVLHRISGIHKSPSPEMQELISKNLSSQSQSIPLLTPIDSIELTTRAVGAMEYALYMQSIHTNDESGPRMSANTTNSHPQFVTPAIMVGGLPENIALDLDSLFTYSIILNDLSILQERRKQIPNAYATKKRALEILRFLSTKYPQSKRVLEKTSSILSMLYGHRFCALNSTAQNIEYAKECVDIYRELFRKTESSDWLLSLSWALSALGRFLVTAGRPDDAEAVYEEMKELTQVALQMFFDLKLPSEIEGDYHFHLAVSYRAACRTPDAIYAAHNAVAQFSALGFMDPQRSPFKHVKALSLLCQLYCMSQQYHLALSEGYKAFSIIDRTVTKERTTTAFTEIHIKLIDSVMEALEKEADVNYLGKATEIMGRFRALIAANPKWDSSTFWAPAIFTTILQKNRMTDQAISYAQDFLSSWKDAHRASDDPNIMNAYIRCSKVKTETLKQQGKLDEALQSNTQAIDFAKGYPTGSFDSSRRMIANAQVSLLCDLGRYQEAVDFSQKQFDSYSQTDTQAIITGLQSLGLAQIYNNMPLKAISTATEAVSRCRSEISKGQTYPYAWLFISLLIVADGHFDVGRVDEALAHVDAAKQASAATSQLSSSKAVHQAIISREARLLFVKRNYPRVHDLVVEMMVYDKELMATNDLFPARRFARTLRFAGLAFCCAGEHEKGLESGKDLDALMEKLSVSNPAFACGTQYMLDMETKRGMWQMIQAGARADLGCNHQDEVLEDGGKASGC